MKKNGPNGPSVKRPEDLDDGWITTTPSGRKTSPRPEDATNSVVTESKNWESRLLEGWDKET